MGPNDAECFLLFMSGEPGSLDTVKGPQWVLQGARATRLPNLLFTMSWGRGSLEQCLFGSAHNSLCFLFLCLTSCYAKISWRGQWTVATDGDTHPQEATALCIPKRHTSSRMWTPEGWPWRGSLGRVNSKCRPWKPKDPGSLLYNIQKPHAYFFLQKM